MNEPIVPVLKSNLENQFRTSYFFYQVNACGISIAANNFGLSGIGLFIIFFYLFHKNTNLGVRIRISYSVHSGLNG